MNDGVVVITGQSEAVKNAQALELKRQEEMTDAFGNTVKVRSPLRAVRHFARPESGRDRHGSCCLRSCL